MPASRPNSSTRISTGDATSGPSHGSSDPIELTDLTSSAVLKQHTKEPSRPRRSRVARSARRARSPQLRALRYPDSDDDGTAISPPSTSQAARATRDRVSTHDRQYPEGMTDAAAAEQGFSLQSDLPTRTAVQVSVGADKTLGCITCGRRGRRSQRTEDRTDALASELGSAAVGQTVDQGTTACCSLC